MLESMIDENDHVALAKTFAKFLAIPSVSKAHFTEKDGIVSVYSEWSSDDVPSKTKSTFAKIHSLGKSGDKLVLLQESMPIPINVKLTCVSPSGSKKAVGTRNPSSKESDGEILQIFSKDKLEKTLDLNELDLHKGIYTNSMWGSTMTWSADESKLMYLAEQKTAKKSPFLAQSSKQTGKGDEFEFRQSWGEQLTDAFQSVVVVLDVDREEFKVLDLPDKIFPSDLQWVGSSSIVGTGYTDFTWRLGLIYCSNRDSRIFQVDSDGTNFKYLSEPGFAAFSPRVRPDGSLLVFQQRKAEGPHDYSRAIIGLKLKEGEKPYVIYADRPANRIPIYANFPQSCWTSGTKFLTVTPNDIGFALLAFNISDEEVAADPEITHNANKILWIGKNYVLISKSHSVNSDALHLLDVDDLTKFHVVSAEIRPLSGAVERIIVTIEGLSPPSFYYRPLGPVPDKSVRLIVIPHGGPHSVLSDEFSPEIVFFLKLGYGILRINYIGSIGGSSDPADLCGKIGSVDLENCQNTVKKLLAHDVAINPDKIAVYGGSHGGFLGAHLTSSFPDFYKAASLRNPVTDLVAIFGASDITDWAYVEGGLPHEPRTYLPFVRNVTDAEKLIQSSPIQHAKKVKAATLLLLGSEDIRVPMSQGLAYYRALKHFNKITEVRLFNDCHSLQKKVPCRFDAMMQTVLWFKKYLN